MNDKSNAQNDFSKVLEKIQEIVEKSADGDYIYRVNRKSTRSIPTMERFPQVCIAHY